MQAFTLRKEVMEASFEESAINEFVGYAPLNEFSIHDINDFFVRQMIKVEDCDILVCASTEERGEVIRVPKVVNQMLKYIDCELAYSLEGFNQE